MNINIVIWNCLFIVDFLTMIYTSGSNVVMEGFRLYFDITGTNYMKNNYSETSWSIFAGMRFLL